MQQSQLVTKNVSGDTAGGSLTAHVWPLGGGGVQVVLVGSADCRSGTRKKTE